MTYTGLNGFVKGFNATMKKFLMLMAIIPMLSGCNYAAFSLGSYNWKKIHISVNNDVGRCYEVVKWYDNQTGIEVDLKDYGHVFLSEGTAYILVADKCPICDKEQIMSKGFME